VINFISEIFLAHKYELETIEFEQEGYKAILMYPAIDTGKQEYFIIVEHREINDTIIDQLLNYHIAEFSHQLNLLKVTDGSFTKNCTMILCCPKGKTSDHELLKFEEDPYHFKKNVITYTAKELENIKLEFKGKTLNSSNYNEKVQVSAGNLFEKFKSEKLPQDHFYHLLMRIITKLPIINYVNIATELDDLESEINKKLTPNENRLLDFILKSDFEADSKELLTNDWRFLNE